MKDKKELPEWYQMTKEFFSEIQTFDHDMFSNLNGQEILSQLYFVAIRDTMPQEAMSNPAKVVLYCNNCFHWGTPMHGIMRCGNCDSWDTERFEQTEPVMSAQAWNMLAYSWGKWRDIDYYHAMADIDETRQKHGDARTIQIFLEGIAKDNTIT